MQSKEKQSNRKGAFSILYLASCVVSCGYLSKSTGRSFQSVLFSIIQARETEKL
jgi:hypothetical protein